MRTLISIRQRQKHHSPESLLYLAGVLTALSSDPTPTRVKVTAVSCGPYQHRLPYGGLPLPSTDPSCALNFRRDSYQAASWGRGDGSVGIRTRVWIPNTT